MAASGLGKILLHEGLIGEKNLKIIEKTCHQAHAGIAKAVLTIGLLDEEELASLLVERTQFKRIPRQFHRQHSGRTDPSIYLPLPFIQFLEVYPYDIHNGRLDVVTLDPMDYGVIRQVEFFSGYPVRPHVASLSELVALIRTILPDFRPEEPNLQDFLIDYSVSSAQTLLHVGPTLTAPPPLASVPFAPAPPPELTHAEQAADSAKALSRVKAEDLPAAPEGGAGHHEEVSEPESPSDLSQDVMDIFDEEASAEPAQEAEAEQTAEPEREPEPEQTAEPEPEQAAEPEPALEQEPEPEPAREQESEPEDLAEIPLEAPAEAKGEELELVEIAAEPALSADLVDEPSPAAEPDAEVALSAEGLGEAIAPLDVEDLPLEGAAEPERDGGEATDELIDDITPADAEDSPVGSAVPLTPLEGAVRVLNEGLIKLSLGIGGEPDEAAIATWAKIAPTGKIVRIGASAADDGPATEVIGWDADGEIHKSEGEGEAAEVIELIAARSESDGLCAAEGWRTVADKAHTWQTTGYVDDEGQSGLYLVAGIEDEFCTDEAFAQLSQQFLKLWHQKWAG